MKLYGKNSVVERLRTNPASIKKIFLQQGHKGFGSVQKKAQQKKIPIFMVPPLKMQKIGRGKNAQGIMMDVEDFEYVEYDDLLSQALDKGRCPIFMDGVTDPQNLGAIIRSVACLGKFSVVLPTHNSVSVTESVLRVAAGGENYVPVARVANLAKAIRQAKEKGFQVAGSVVKGGSPVNETEWPYPVALVIGSEEKGVRDVIQAQLDVALTIPMPVDTLSFNVAHATTILCYDITKQKKEYKKRQNASVSDGG